jgi:hypothetical protein
MVETNRFHGDVWARTLTSVMNLTLETTMNTNLALSLTRRALARVLDAPAVQFSAFLLVAALLAATAVSIESGFVLERIVAETMLASSPPERQVQPSATFTGEYADGAPVYRLPPVTVVAERDGAAQANAESKPAHVREARAKASAKPPV